MELAPLPEQIELPPLDVQEVYSAHPLESGSKQIRVLDILPPTTAAANEAIRSTLSVIDLESDTDFAALSYVWGTYAVQRDTIICDDVRFEVTRNCYSALWHLRRKLGGFRIWLDAICINQEDIKEKSGQIPLMGDIYTHASLVYVWLGLGNKHTDRAMAYMSTAGFKECFQTKPDGTTEFRHRSAMFSHYTSKISPTRHPYPFTRKSPSNSRA